MWGCERERERDSEREREREKKRKEKKNICRAVIVIVLNSRDCYSMKLDRHG